MTRRNRTENAYQIADYFGSMRGAHIAGDQRLGYDADLHRADHQC
jgi:hypothetical protein